MYFFNENIYISTFWIISYVLLAKNWVLLSADGNMGKKKTDTIKRCMIRLKCECENDRERVEWSGGEVKSHSFFFCCSFVEEGLVRG